jgi:hypothetical protein
MHQCFRFIVGVLAAGLTLFPGSLNSGCPAGSGPLIKVRGSISIKGGKGVYWFEIRDSSNKPVTGALVSVNGSMIHEEGYNGIYKTVVPVSFAGPLTINLSVKPPQAANEAACVVQGTVTFPALVNFVKPASGQVFTRNSGPGIPFHWRTSSGPTRVILDVFSPVNDLFFGQAGLTQTEYVLPWNSIPAGQGHFRATVEISAVTNIPLTGSVASGSLVSARAWSQVEFAIQGPAPAPKPLYKR